MDSYRIIRQLGKGNYGTVHLAEHVPSGSLVALKRIPVDFSSKDKERTLREVALMSHLSHPCIVQAYDAFIQEGTLHLVMEFCSGGDLGTCISSARRAHTVFSERQVLDWFTQLTMALAHIHSKRVLHRDLKSGNVFLTSANTVRLGDFGIARVLQSTFDAAKTVIGTPYYLSPEVCRNASYDEKSDVWSLGCVLYELLSLRHAFSSSNLLALVFKIVQEGHPPLPASCPPRLAALVDCLLAKEAGDRPTAEQILCIPFITDRLEAMAHGPVQQLAETAQGWVQYIRSPSCRIQGLPQAAQDRLRTVVDDGLVPEVQGSDGTTTAGMPSPETARSGSSASSLRSMPFGDGGHSAGGEAAASDWAASGGRGRSSSHDVGDLPVVDEEVKSVDDGDEDVLGQEDGGVHVHGRGYRDTRLSAEGKEADGSPYHSDTPASSPAPSARQQHSPVASARHGHGHDRHSPVSSPGSVAGGQSVAHAGTDWPMDAHRGHMSAAVGKPPRQPYGRRPTSAVDSVQGIRTSPRIEDGHEQYRSSPSPRHSPVSDPGAGPIRRRGTWASVPDLPSGWPYTDRKPGGQQQQHTMLRQRSLDSAVSYPQGSPTDFDSSGIGSSSNIGSGTRMGYSSTGTGTGTATGITGTPLTTGTAQGRLAPQQQRIQRQGSYTSATTSSPARGVSQTPSQTPGSGSREPGGRGPGLMIGPSPLLLATVSDMDSTGGHAYSAMGPGRGRPEITIGSLQSGTSGLGIETFSLLAPDATSFGQGDQTGVGPYPVYQLAGMRHVDFGHGPGDRTSAVGGRPDSSATVDRPALDSVSMGLQGVTHGRAAAESGWTAESPGPGSSDTWSSPGRAQGGSARGLSSAPEIGAGAAFAQPGRSQLVAAGTTAGTRRPSIVSTSTGAESRDTGGVRTGQTGGMTSGYGTATARPAPAAHAVMMQQMLPERTSSAPPASSAPVGTVAGPLGFPGPSGSQAFGWLRQAAAGPRAQLQAQQGPGAPGLFTAGHGSGVLYSSSTTGRSPTSLRAAGPIVQQPSLAMPGIGPGQPWSKPSRETSWSSERTAEPLNSVGSEGSHGAYRAESSLQADGTAASRVAVTTTTSPTYHPRHGVVPAGFRSASQGIASTATAAATAAAAAASAATGGIAKAVPSLAIKQAPDAEDLYTGLRRTSSSASYGDTGRDTERDSPGLLVAESFRHLGRHPLAAPSWPQGSNPTGADVSEAASAWVVKARPPALTRGEDVVADADDITYPTPAAVAPAVLFPDQAHTGVGDMCLLKASPPLDGQTGSAQAEDLPVCPILPGQGLDQAAGERVLLQCLPVGASAALRSIHAKAGRFGRGQAGLRQLSTAGLPEGRVPQSAKTTSHAEVVSMARQQVPSLSLAGPVGLPKDLPAAHDAAPVPPVLQPPALQVVTDVGPSPSLGSVTKATPLAAAEASSQTAPPSSRAAFSARARDVPSRYGSVSASGAAGSVGKASPWSREARLVAGREQQLTSSSSATELASSRPELLTAPASHGPMPPRKLSGDRSSGVASGPGMAGASSPARSSPLRMAQARAGGFVPTSHSGSNLAGAVAMGHDRAGSDSVPRDAPAREACASRGIGVVSTPRAALKRRTSLGGQGQASTPTAGDGGDGARYADGTPQLLAIGPPVGLAAAPRLVTQVAVEHAAQQPSARGTPPAQAAVASRTGLRALAVPSLASPGLAVSGAGSAQGSVGTIQSTGRGSGGSGSGTGSGSSGQQARQSGTPYGGGYGPHLATPSKIPRPLLSAARRGTAPASTASPAAASEAAASFPPAPKQVAIAPIQPQHAVFASPRLSAFSGPPVATTGAPRPAQTPGNSHALGVDAPGRGAAPVEARAARVNVGAPTTARAANGRGGFSHLKEPPSVHRADAGPPGPASGAPGRAVVSTTRGHGQRSSQLGIHMGVAGRDYDGAEFSKLAGDQEEAAVDVGAGYGYCSQGPGGVLATARAAQPRQGWSRPWDDAQPETPGVSAAVVEQASAPVGMSKQTASGRGSGPYRYRAPSAPFVPDGGQDGAVGQAPLLQQPSRRGISASRRPLAQDVEGAPPGSPLPSGSPTASDAFAGAGPETPSARTPVRTPARGYGVSASAGQQRRATSLGRAKPRSAGAVAGAQAVVVQTSGRESGLGPGVTEGGSGKANSGPRLDTGRVERAAPIGEQAASGSPPADDVSGVYTSSTAAAIRQRCRAALGPLMFDRVYGYLRKRAVEKGLLTQGGQAAAAPGGGPRSSPPLAGRAGGAGPGSGPGPAGGRSVRSAAAGHGEQRLAGAAPARPSGSAGVPQKAWDESKPALIQEPAEGSVASDPATCRALCRNLSALLGPAHSHLLRDALAVQELLWVEAFSSK